MPICFHCKREIQPNDSVRLPDAEVYCMNCCESMATDSFEMETGQRFTEWIINHPRLIMRYQPLEISVRRLQFLFPAFCMLLGVAMILAGCWQYGQAGHSIVHLSAYFAAAFVLTITSIAYAAERIGKRFIAHARALIFILAAAQPVAAVLGIYIYGRSAALIVGGFYTVIIFGWLAARGLIALVRAKGFQLTLENGVFDLKHGKHTETFTVADLTRVCVVRPGTVGATEGALGLKDGRMLTLDTCLSDLHALGVVLDLRFREDFPPSAEDLARERRNKLRKIRGLS